MRTFREQRRSATERFTKRAKTAFDTGWTFVREWGFYRQLNSTSVSVATSNSVEPSTDSTKKGRSVLMWMTPTFALPGGTISQAMIPGCGYVASESKLGPLIQEVLSTNNHRCPFASSNWNSTIPGWGSSLTYRSTVTFDDEHLGAKQLPNLLALAYH